MQIKKLRELSSVKRDKFVELLCGMKLTEYQKKVLYDDSKRIVVCASRQIGKSTVVALKALWKAWCFDNQDIMIIAPTERQAEIVYSKIREKVLSNFVFYNTVEKVTMRKMVFDNGSVIRCLPAGHTGEFIRGYTCDMIIADEAQSIDDEVFVSVIPSLVVKEGQLILLGTPSRGKVGFFWHAWISDDWSKHRITINESPFANINEVEAFRKMKGEIAFRREMMAEFVDADDLFFDIDLVYKRAKLTKKKHSPAEKYDYYIGIDWARMGSDQNAIVVLGLNEMGILEMHNYYLRRKKTMTEVLNWAVDTIREWRPIAVGIDCTSGWATMGDLLRERLTTIGINTRLTEINFSKQNLRREVYWNLKRMIDEGTILLLKDDAVLKQFDSFRVRYTASGTELIKKEGESDDIVDAIAMACWAYAGGVGKVKIDVAEFIDIDNLYKMGERI